jgi:ribulose-phosphate 3-epimerase
MLIIPAILTNNSSELKDFLSRAEQVVRRVQIDINDGSFLGEKTIFPEALIGLETDLFLDFHLMVKEPFHWVEKSAMAGAERIIGQVELMGDQKDFVSKVQEVGPKVGLALDIKTPVSVLDRSILEDIDLILLMGHQAGKGGQSFDNSVLPKIFELMEIRKHDATPFAICVDGGVWIDNILKLDQLGVDEVVVGRRLFKGDIKDNINLLEEELRL